MQAVSKFDSDVALRVATLADVPAIAALHLASWRSAYRGITPDAFLDAITPESRIARWERAFAPDEVRTTETVVAVRDETIVGLCSFGPRRDPLSSTVGEIYALHIEPDLRHAGLGTLLLGDACFRLVARRFVSIVLWVLRDNLDARRFYEARGWTLTGEELLEEHSGFTIPEVRYALELGA
jgi:ribosomal protein S18 acetylase RimI-like enzyme